MHPPARGVDEVPDLGRVHAGVGVVARLRRLLAARAAASAALAKYEGALANLDWPVVDRPVAAL
jgi:hypothetical protein